MWVSDPTWENHVAIFEGAGFKVETYPWFDSETNGVRVDALLEKLNTCRSAVSYCCIRAAITRRVRTSPMPSGMR